MQLVFALTASLMVVICLVALVLRRARSTDAPPSSEVRTKKDQLEAAMLALSATNAATAAASSAAAAASCASSASSSCS